ncbi:tyrosinase [Mycena floridula]|nr:tyrosinase [Mycena floridula]
MRAFSLITIVLTSLTCAFAAPSDLAVADAALDAAASSSSSPICLLPLERQEWRVLNDTQKEDYISAIQCLMELPAVTAFEGVKTRFDDFQALHVALTYEIHWVGQFLPWHRRFVALYESTLRSECGYEGAQPYWDWTLDADTGTITNSPIFDPVHGFGGNGAFIEGWRGFFGNLTTPPGSGGGCIQDGPFKDYNLSIGPGTLVTNHCISRAINDNLVQYMTTAQFLNTTNQPTFELFRQEIGAAFKPPPLKIHDGGHGGVNGEMGNVFSSPGDPLFFLHHAALDRVWAIWQDFNPSARLSEISGYTTFAAPFTNITLDFPLKMSTLGPLNTVGEVMNTRDPLLCYIYI